MQEKVTGEKLKLRCVHMYEAAQRWWAENGVSSEHGTEKFLDTPQGMVRVLEYGFENENAPLLFNLHGGGWILLHAESDEYLVSRISRLSGVRIVSIDYPKGPDNPFPTALEASYHIIKKYAGSSPVGVMGQSAGGNIAAALSILSRRRGDINIACQILNYPVLDLVTDAYDKPAPDPEHMPASKSYIFAACYAGASDRSDPLISPLFASDGELKNAPDAFFTVCGIDALRREALGYEERLRSLGVKTEVREFESMRHAFTTEDLPETAEAAGYIAEFVRKKLF